MKIRNDSSQINMIFFLLKHIWEQNNNIIFDKFLSKKKVRLLSNKKITKPYGKDFMYKFSYNLFMCVFFVFLVYIDNYIQKIKEKRPCNKIK